jgi:hypothetical protein
LPIPFLLLSLPISSVRKRAAGAQSDFEQNILSSLFKLWKSCGIISIIKRYEPYSRCNP